MKLIVSIFSVVCMLLIFVIMISITYPIHWLVIGLCYIKLNKVARYVSWFRQELDNEFLYYLHLLERLT